MQRLKNAFYEHRFGLFFFVFLMAYSFIVSGNMQVWKVDDLTYSFHAIDFSVGFCSRVLPGAICNWIFGTVSEAKVSVYMTVLFICCFLMIAFMLEKLFLRTETEHRYATIIMIVFFLTGPGAFTPHVRMFGMFDFYWLLLSVLSVIFLEHKYLRFAIIPCMFLMAFIYHGALICYIPFLVLVVLFKISITESKKEKAVLFIILAAAVAAAVAISLYMMVFEYDNVRLTVDELKNMLQERGVTSTEYYEESFYSWTDEQIEEEFGLGKEDFYLTTDADKGFSGMIKAMIQRVTIHFRLKYIGKNLTHFILIAPVIFVIMKFLTNQLKENKANKLKSFCLFCAGGLFFFTTIVSGVMSTDRIRWLSNATVPLFAFVFYTLYKGEETDRAKISSIIEAIPMKLIVPYYVFYAVTVGAL